jgi:hypothetical protein
MGFNSSADSGFPRRTGAMSSDATIVAVFPTPLRRKGRAEGRYIVRRVMSVSILIALLVLPATGATADEDGVRSGTIVVASLSGLGGGYPRGCELTADCLAWLASRCDPALAGRDPALETSIEDVADLAPAGALFEHEPARAYATVQFWQQDCTEIGSRTQIESGKALLIIPSSARWMTVTGYTFNPWATWPPLPNATGLTLDWTLTAYPWSESGPASPSPAEPSEPQPSPASEWDGEERSVALALRGHLRAVGKVVSNEEACTVDVPIVVQRKGSRDWIDIASSTTDADGAFAVRLGDRGGRYRVVALEVATRDGVCAETKSSPSRHRHQ